MKLHTTAIYDLPKPTDTIGLLDFLKGNIEQLAETTIKVVLVSFAAFSAIYFLIVYLNVIGYLPMNTVLTDFY